MEEVYIASITFIYSLIFLDLGTITNGSQETTECKELNLNFSYVHALQPVELSFKS